jgi:pimeloyl-ACP methyl ester carboxylesterase
MTISIIETAKGKIEYYLRGQGTPILFVHGGHVNCRETVFQKGLDPDKFCFITPSRPGYGRTPLTDLNKTPKETADLFIALLDQLKLHKVIVIGISAGGLTALEIAANYAERVESLVLMSALTKKWFDKTDKVYIGGKKLFAPRIEGLTWSFYRISLKLFPKVMTTIMFKELSNYRPVEFTVNELKELKQITMNMRSGYGFHNDLDQTIEQEILSRIECPTLILHSENDNAVDYSHSLNAKNNIKNSKLLVFKNRWGHFLWLGPEYNHVLAELKRQLIIPHN